MLVKDKLITSLTGRFFGTPGRQPITRIIHVFTFSENSESGRQVIKFSNESSLVINP